MFTVVGFSNLVFANNNNDVTLPIELSTQGFPVTSVQIQNHNIPLIFDTGASKSSIVLSKKLVKVVMNLKEVSK